MLVVNNTHLTVLLIEFSREANQVGYGRSSNISYGILQNKNNPFFFVITREPTAASL